MLNGWIRELKAGHYQMYKDNVIYNQFKLLCSIKKKVFNDEFCENLWFCITQILKLWLMLGLT